MVLKLLNLSSHLTSVSREGGIELVVSTTKNIRRGIQPDQSLGRAKGTLCGRNHETTTDIDQRSEADWSWNSRRGCDERVVNSLTKAPYNSAPFTIAKYPSVKSCKTEGPCKLEDLIHWENALSSYSVLRKTPPLPYSKEALSTRHQLLHVLLVLMSQIHQQQH